MSAPYSIIKKDCISFLQSCNVEFDIVFFDPPWYEQALYDQIVPLLFEYLSQSATIIIEYKKKSKVRALMSSYDSLNYHYGDTSLSVIRL